jgi:hypothetical protein
MEVQDLVGEVLAYIDVDGDSIRMETMSGKVVMLQHHQDCCESVTLYNIDGDLRCLIGKPIVSAESECPSDPVPEGSYAESHTWTVYKFAVDGATVVTKWFGESNGYYGEGVDIDDVTHSVEGLMPREFGVNARSAEREEWQVASDYWADKGDASKSDACKKIAKHGIFSWQYAE